MEQNRKKKISLPPTAKVTNGNSILIPSILLMQNVSDQPRREGFTKISKSDK